MEKITPAILARSDREFHTDLVHLVAWAPALHLDYCDGQFVGGLTVPVGRLTGLGITTPRELHLMASNPVPLARDAFAHGVDRVIIHCEALQDARELRDLPLDRVIIAINPETLLSRLGSYHETKHFLVMGIHPGVQGAAFLPETVDRLKELKIMRPDAQLIVDGGVNRETIAGLVQAGVGRCIVGSDILRARIPEEEYDYLVKMFE